MKSKQIPWGIVLPLLLSGFAAGIQAQTDDCFRINTALSKITLNTGVEMKLPGYGDTLRMPCSKTIYNCTIVIDFDPNTEKYFEDSTQFVAVLSYKNSTIILNYDKAANTFRLPPNQPPLRDGTYSLIVSSINCLPPLATCDNCTISYWHQVEYINDAGLQVIIKPDSLAPLLTCFPGSQVTLYGTPPPHNGFKSKWEIFQNNNFTDIPGASGAVYVASQAGMYRYWLSGPGGCTISDTIALDTPQRPDALVIPDTQTLSACAQKITGVQVSNFGPPANLQFGWTASSNGLLIDGADMKNPVVGAPGTYTLKVTRLDNGCTDEAGVLLIPGPIPVVMVQTVATPGGVPLDCRIKEINLRAIASLSAGSSPFTYAWSNGTTGPETTVSAPGAYSVTVTATTSGCKGAAVANVQQDISKPAIQISSPRDTVCSGEKITLTAIAQEPVAYAWDDNTAAAFTTVTPPLPGANAYQLTVTAAGNGCTNSAVKWIERVDEPLVTCMADAFTVPDGAPLNLDCSTDGYSFIWVALPTNVRDIPVAGTGPIQSQILLLADKEAPGSVHYIFYGKNAGCTGDRYDMQIIVLPESQNGIYIPELITPNGDGTNDQWNIVVPETVVNPDAYRLTLFNRNGAQVYEAPLTATFHVENYPDGTYYYTVSKPDGGQLRGAVTIIRRQ